MMHLKELTSFYSAIKSDHRIGATHINLYMALFQFYNLNRLTNPILITRTAVIEVAKIRGHATYHKGMKDLVEFGYIQYQPSYNPSISSQVVFLMVGNF